MQECLSLLLQEQVGTCGGRGRRSLQDSHPRHVQRRTQFATRRMDRTAHADQALSLTTCPRLRHSKSTASKRSTSARLVRPVRGICTT